MHDSTTTAGEPRKPTITRKKKQEFGSGRGSVLTLQHKIQCSTVVSKLPFGNLLLIKCSPNVRYLVARKLNYDMKG